jgi:hypothetical protein
VWIDLDGTIQRTIVCVRDPSLVSTWDPARRSRSASSTHSRWTSGGSDAPIFAIFVQKALQHSVFVGLDPPARAEVMRSSPSLELQNHAETDFRSVYRLPPIPRTPGIVMASRQSSGMEVCMNASCASLVTPLGPIEHARAIQARVEV